MRLAWATDIHLNFVDAPARHSFIESLGKDTDAVVISGDIGESLDVEDYLRELADSLKRPIYFVLGNHDFYRGSIARTRESVARLAAQSDYLVYLTTEQIVELTRHTALIGHDGWADARLGDFESSDIILNDYVLIEELRQWKNDRELDKDRLRQVLNALGDEAAKHFEATLAKAAKTYDNVIAVTHVPPFYEATWHEGSLSDDNWLPHFSCKAVGNVLLDQMQSHRSCNLLVLCGHTHSSGEAKLLDNLTVLTGSAKYRQPAIQRVLRVA